MKIVDSTSTYVPATGKIVMYNYGGNNVESQKTFSNGAPFQVGVSRSYGDNYPDWRERLASHSGAVTYLSVTETSVTVNGSADCYVIHPQRVIQNSSNACKATLKGNFSSVSAPTLPLERELVHVDNVAKTQYLKKLNQQIRSLQGLVTIGEISETVRLILRPGRAIVRYTERLKRDNERLRRRASSGARRRRSITNTELDEEYDSARKSNFGTPSTFADLWLAYSFGVRPLLGEIDDAMKALARILHPEGVPQFYKIKANSEASYPTISKYQVEYWPFKWDLEQTVRTDLGVRYYGEVDLKFMDIDNASTQLGMDFLSIVPAAWELVPWSFLVDYFSNIGEVLESLSVPQSAVRWNAKGYILTRDVTVKQSNLRLSGQMAQEGWQLHGSLLSEVRTRGRILKRVPNPGYVLPTFEFPSITDFARKWRQQVNVLALAIARVGKH